MDEQLYKTMLGKVENLMSKGSAHLTDTEEAELIRLAGEISHYESMRFPLPKPQSLEAMIEWKMYEMRIKQKDLARLLDEPESRISEIITGKRGINIRQAKKLYKLLHIPADFILEHS